MLESIPMAHPSLGVIPFGSGISISAVYFNFLSDHAPLKFLSKPNGFDLGLVKLILDVAPRHPGECANAMA